MAELKSLITQSKNSVCIFDFFATGKSTPFTSNRPIYNDLVFLAANRTKNCGLETMYDGISIPDD